jgi:hypothetical protein
MRYQVEDVELELFDSAVTFGWKGGRSYHEIGRLRFAARRCVFGIYRDALGAVLVTVDYVGVCEMCIAEVRQLTRERGYELVERRAVLELRGSCAAQGVPASLASPRPASTPLAPSRVAGGTNAGGASSTRSTSPPAGTQRSPVGVSAQVSAAAHSPRHGNFSQ